MHWLLWVFRDVLLVYLDQVAHFTASLVVCVGVAVVMFVGFQCFVEHELLRRTTTLLVRTWQALSKEQAEYLIWLLALVPIVFVLHDVVIPLLRETDGPRALRLYYSLLFLAGAVFLGTSFVPSVSESFHQPLFSLVLPPLARIDSKLHLLLEPFILSPPIRTAIGLLMWLILLDLIYLILFEWPLHSFRDL